MVKNTSKHPKNTQKVVKNAKKHLKTPPKSTINPPKTARNLLRLLEPRVRQSLDVPVEAARKVLEGRRAAREHNVAHQAAAGGVAVVVWLWYRWIEDVRAVILVPGRVW
jgi:hypothetical protein